MNHDLPTNVGRYATQEAGYQATLDFIEKAQRLGMHGDVLMDNQQTTNNGYVFKVEWDYDTVNLEYAREVLDSIIAGQDTVVNNYQNLISARWAGLNNIVSFWAETNFLYNDLNGQMQNIAKTMIGGIDFASLGLDTEEKVHNYVEDYILRPLFLASPEVKTAFDNLLDLQGSLKNGDITPEGFQEQVQDMFDGLFESIDVEKERNGWGFTGTGWVSLEYIQKISSTQTDIKTEDDDMTELQVKEICKQVIAEQRKELQDNDCGSWSKAAREWATSTGLIAGGGALPDGTPNYMWADQLTREQAAALFFRFAQMMGKV